MSRFRRGRNSVAALAAGPVRSLAIVVFSAIPGSLSRQGHPPGISTPATSAAHGIVREDAECLVAILHHVIPFLNP